MSSTWFDKQLVCVILSLSRADQRWYMFQNMGPAPSGRSGHAMASMGTRVFVLGGESFTPTKGDDHGIINVLDTEHIKYPDSSKGPPTNKANRESIATPPPGQVAPGSSLPNVTGAIDADDIRWTMSQPRTRFGTRTPNGARAQSSPNTKDKAPNRSQRDDRIVLRTDDGNGTETGATLKSNTTSRDHTPSPEQIRAPSYLPQDLTNELQGRSRYPITSGGFGDIWKCELVKPDGTVKACPASPTSYSCY
ncbi:hypothetical protein DFJ58DRAFT_130968 [Suillus subalutaceus]|uniref:uncharacterized protein n=1 Tax=Suillus subalutaceus TaxID=48586 RepID=UPI001B879EEF|nr:uncharacterized protein DFJ58DRAFT_130968 [Suillus subalutaceus]KAG1867303.1 hypothetical protein DFJ58DRAFT_130968 [Suillus subalutaceus]